MGAFKKIHFSIGAISEDNIKEELVWFLSALYKNGQIYFDYQLIKEEKGYVAYITIPEENALDNKYMNSYLLDYLKNISFSVENIGENVDIDECCHCKDVTIFFLKTSYIDNGSPVKCGKCSKAIPLCKIPYILGEDEHFSILSWQKNYKAIDHLWMQSLADRFTKLQLESPRSQLFIQAMEIRNELEQILQYPVYYYIYFTGKVPIHCPICSSTWQEINNCDCANLLCHQCRISTFK